MLREERQRQIADMLRVNGRVEVSNLCRIFNVTEMTIRRDLNELAERNQAVRSHGGAVLPADLILSESPYEVRIAKHIAEKEAIARAALRFIRDGDKIFFDSSTTVYCIARLIKNEQHFVAVTDTLQTATELNARSGVRVFCLGGELQKTTGSCSGVFTEGMLDGMYFNTAFIGLSNISKRGILTTSSQSELTLKQKVLARSERAVILVDSSKLGSPDFLEIGRLVDIHVLITDDGMDADLLRECQSAGVETIIVHPEPVAGQE